MAKDKEPILSVRLPQSLLARIATELAMAKTGRLRDNPTISEFVRAALEEKLARCKSNRVRGAKEKLRCIACGRLLPRSEMSVTLTDLFGVEEGKCHRCENQAPLN